MHYIEPSRSQTDATLVDKLSFYRGAHESTRRALSSTTWPSIDFFDFQMRLADKVLAADEHLVLGAHTLDAAEQSKITDPVELQRALTLALSGPTQSLWIESEFGLRFEALHKVIEQIGLLPNYYGPNPSRIGLLASKEKDHKILLRAVWYDEETKYVSTLDQDSSINDKAYQELMYVHSFPAAMRIDVSENMGLPTLSEFKLRVKNGDPSFLKYFASDRPRSIALAIDLLRPNRDFTEFAWWNYCLDKMIQPELYHDEYDHLYINELMRVGSSRSQIEKEATVSLTSEVAGLAGLTAILSTCGYLTE